MDATEHGTLILQFTQYEPATYAISSNRAQNCISCIIAFDAIELSITPTGRADRKRPAWQRVADDSRCKRGFSRANPWSAHRMKKARRSFFLLLSARRGRLTLIMRDITRVHQQTRVYIERKKKGKIAEPRRGQEKRPVGICN